MEFSPTKNVAWKTAAPFGQSSPVIVADRLFVTAREGDRLLTIAMDVRTGRELWRRDIRRPRAMAMYKANDPASPTPAADDRGVVAIDRATASLSLSYCPRLVAHCDRPGSLRRAAST